MNLVVHSHRAIRPSPSESQARQAHSNLCRLECPGLDAAPLRSHPEDGLQAVAASTPPSSPKGWLSLVLRALQHWFIFRFDFVLATVLQSGVRPRCDLSDYAPIPIFDTRVLFLFPPIQVWISTTQAAA